MTTNDENEIHELRKQLKDQGREFARLNRERAAIEYNLAREQVADAFQALGADRNQAVGWAELLIESEPEVIDLPFLQRWMDGAAQLSAQ